MVKNKGATAMKPSHPLRHLTACAALAALLSMPACSLSPIADPPVTSKATNATNTIASPDKYEALIAQLREEILLLKENDYIARAEYEARIRALEAELAALQNLTESTDLPVWTSPSEITTPDTKKEEPPKEPPATMAFRYSISDGSAIIHEYLGDETVVVIPAVIDGYPVTHISDEAFRSTAVTSVTIPYSVIHVGWFAFADCTKLTAIICTASVESIDYGAFDGCPNLTLYCPQNSYVARYAASFALRHEYT